MARTISRNVNTLGRQQPEASVASDLQGVNVEICVEIVRRLHDRRRRRHDDETAAFADPVDMPMPVHEDTSLRHRLQAAQEPVAVDECRSDALRENLCRARILDRMVVKPDEPAGPRVLREDHVDRARLRRRNHPERIGEGEVGVRVRVQEDDTQTIVAIGR